MNWKKNRELRWGSVVLLTIIFSIVLGTAGFQSAAGRETYSRLKIFTEVLSHVEASYVDQVEPQKLIYGAIRGMLKELDPHSTFMTEDMFKEMQVDTKGQFGGLGITIGLRDDVLTVISPIEDTPAWRAGIQAGDQILKVDGDPTKDMTISDAVKKMRGVPGTSVVITVMRDEYTEPKDFSIVRDIIKLKSVKHRIMGEDIGYIRVTAFQERTDEDLENSLKDILNENPDLRGLVLDLRNNPGGLLDQAIKVSGKFLEKGRLVVYTKGRRSNNDTEFKVRGDDGRTGFPMVVLVNRGSASASEIVAGALQDWQRAVILGTSTFGKGSVQTVIPLEGGLGLRLTTAKYFTPKGRSIQNTGISPDIEVEPATVEVKEVPAGHHPTEIDLKGHLSNDTEKKEETPIKKDEGQSDRDTGDYQLQRALDLLKSWDIFHRLQRTSTAKAE